MSRPRSCRDFLAWKDLAHAEAVPSEVRQRAVRLVLEHRDEYDTAYAAIRSIGATCNVGTETLRKSVRQAAVDAGQRPGVSSEEPAELRG